MNQKINQLSNRWHQQEDGLTVKCEYQDFNQVIEIVNIIANIAEQQNHHPDLHITEFNTLKIVISTHEQEKITQKDWQLAQAIDQHL